MTKLLVKSKNMQLQLSLIQLLSVVLADIESNNIAEMVENSTQSEAQSQIAGNRQVNISIYISHQRQISIL